VDFHRTGKASGAPARGKFPSQNSAARRVSNLEQSGVEGPWKLASLAQIAMNGVPQTSVTTTCQEAGFGASRRFPAASDSGFPGPNAGTNQAISASDGMFSPVGLAKKIRSAAGPISSVLGLVPARMP